MNRRRFLVSLGALGSAALGLGCGDPVPPLRIAGHVWPGYGFMLLAPREGWISPRDTSLIETGSATESIRLLASGQADGAALTLDEALRARAQGVPLTVVLVFDISLGGDVLLARPGIETLAQLKGKRIGYEASGVGALMLYQALAAADLELADVKGVSVTFDRHQQVWRSEAVDALITFEPVSGRLAEEGARRLFDSSQIPGTIVDVLVVTPAAARRHRPALKRLVAAHFRGLTSFRRNPDDMAYRMSERFELPPKSVIRAYRGLELPNEARNRKLLLGDDSEIGETARELAGVMAQAGILNDGQADLANLVSDAFIPREDAI